MSGPEHTAEINRFRNALADCVSSKDHLKAEIERLRETLAIARQRAEVAEMAHREHCAFRDDCTLV